MYISVYCKQFYCRIEGCVPQFSLPLSACISLSLPSLSSYHRVQSQAEPSASVGAPERVSKPESRPPTTDSVWLGRVPKRMPYVTDEETRSLLGPESCHLSFDVAALYSRLCPNPYPSVDTESHGFSQGMGSRRGRYRVTCMC